MSDKTYPADIMKAAEAAYRNVNDLVQPRAESYEAAKIQAFHNPVKIGFIAAALSAERERCAEIAEQFRRKRFGPDKIEDGDECDLIAAAIRAG